MHFNTKYIFQGDSKTEIVNKINYNFNQIMSFAVGPDGTVGPQGPTGSKGPAGKKGIAGSTGQRASVWYKQSTQPLGSVNPYDLWIDTSSSNGEVNFYSATGSWNFTGFSIFDSNYFSTYSWILGPAGSTDKYVIGFSDTANAANLSLVISDEVLDSLNSNPNKSKVVISTADQISRPILSFNKSGAISSNTPSFYWENTGSSSDLIFKSNGELDVTSFLNFGIDTSLASILLQGSNFNSYSTSFNLRGIGDFDFSANTTVGGGANLAISTSNLTLTSQYLTYGGPLRISGSTPGGYVLNDSPTVSQLSGGVSLDVTFKSANSFRFDDLTGNPVLSGKPSGVYSSGNFAQTVFGSTGGFSGGTAGPYSYHVQKIKTISLPAVSVTAYTYPNTTSPITINNVIDISSSSYWDRNVLVITPTSYSSSGGVYIRVPASYLTTINSVYSPGKANYFRILLNTTDTNPSSISILGLVFTVTDFSQNVNNPSSLLSYTNFGSSGCKFLDLQWLAVSNATNANPRLFYKTCVGAGAYVNLTNFYSVGSPPPPVSIPSGGGGGGGGGGYGGGGGGGCFLSGTQISLSTGITKLIEEICIGDKILSYDFASESLVEDLVESVFHYRKNNIVELILGNGSNLSSTTDHPYWVIGKGWSSFDPELTYTNYTLEAQKLEIGDILLTSDLEQMNLIGLKQDEPREFDTFNFHASKTQNYFANGILVHNKQSGLPIE